MILTGLDSGDYNRSNESNSAWKILLVNRNWIPQVSFPIYYVGTQVSCFTCFEAYKWIKYISFKLLVVQTKEIYCFHPQMQDNSIMWLVDWHWVMLKYLFYIMVVIAGMRQFIWVIDKFPILLSTVHMKYDEQYTILSNRCIVSIKTGLMDDKISLCLYFYYSIIVFIWSSSPLLKGIFASRCSHYGMTKICIHTQIIEYF